MQPPYFKSAVKWQQNANATVLGDQRDDSGTNAQKLPVSLVYLELNGVLLTARGEISESFAEGVKFHFTVNRFGFC